MAGILSRLLGRAAAEPSWVEVAGLRQLLASEKPPLVLDVREPDEFEGPFGHIDGALNVPLPEVPARQREIAAAGKAVVCVCLTDKRSAAAAGQLAAAGLSEVTVLRGGMKAWRER